MEGAALEMWMRERLWPKPRSPSQSGGGGGCRRSPQAEKSLGCRSNSCSCSPRSGYLQCLRSSL